VAVLLLLLFHSVLWQYFFFFFSTLYCGSTSSSFRSPLHLDFSFRYESGGLL
jgi:hypothetical protein